MQFFSKVQKSPNKWLSFLHDKPLKRLWINISKSSSFKIARAQFCRWNRFHPNKRKKGFFHFMNFPLSDLIWKDLDVYSAKLRFLAVTILGWLDAIKCEMMAHHSACLELEIRWASKFAIQSLYELILRFRDLLCLSFFWKGTKNNISHNNSFNNKTGSSQIFSAWSNLT